MVREKGSIVKILAWVMGMFFAGILLIIAGLIPARVFQMYLFRRGDVD